MPAKDLYSSEWFRKARRYVERAQGSWLVLSAGYGLVDPEEIIDPYDITLSTMGIEERRVWARRIQSQLMPHLIGSPRVIVFAGQRYREFLIDFLREHASSVEIPLEGLRIGEQLGWFGRVAPIAKDASSES